MRPITLYIINKVFSNFCFILFVWKETKNNMKTIFTTLLTLFILTIFPSAVKAQKQLLATYSEILLNGSFSPYDSTFFEYDGNGNVAAELYKYYDPADGKWKNLLRYEYTYNANDNILTKLTQLWQNNTWTANTFITNLYDNGLLTSSNETRWMTNKWENFSKKEYFYGNLNKPDSVLNTFYGNSSFTPNIKNIFSYNSDKNVIEDNEFYWVSQTWIPAYKTSYTYNSAKQNTQYIVEVPNQQGWKVTNTVTMVYDNGGDIDKWERKNETGVVDFKQKYFYKSSVGIESLERLSIKVYPNPTSNYINFDLKENTDYDIKIIDFTGKTIKTIEANNSTKIDISELKTGIYFYNILNTTTQQNASGKFVVSQ